METLPTLDAHAHIYPHRTQEEVANSGAVLSMTLALDAADAAMDRHDALIAWGVGCHPRFPKFQEAFDADRFRALVQCTAIVGEIGLDQGSRVPLERQLQTFRQAQDVLSDLPRLVSIHSYQATALVLEELRQRPVTVPVLHWWTGTVAETREAVRLGCYFSIHSQVARQSRFRTSVPIERVLLESDHGYDDPPAAIPLRVGWVEYLVAQQYRMDVVDVRRLVWHNFAAIIRQTDTINFLPGPLANIVTAQADRFLQQNSLLGSG
jgi:TatD DNase family protein